MGTGLFTEGSSATHNNNIFTQCSNLLLVFCPLQMGKVGKQKNLRNRGKKVVI